ncbi:MAG: hypothetical protein JWM57_3751, partial [Phycisphaerales bacterium]|nr:hypothetical protein [Phycisphaerales bacterium]
MTAAVSIPFDRAELDGSVPARFARVVAALPDALAICDSNVSWTYRMLDERSDQLATALLSSDPTPDGCVVYLAEHSAEMVLCALAALRAGLPYVCLHPKQPGAAQAEILRDARPSVFVATASKASIAEGMLEGSTKLLILESIPQNGPTPQWPTIAASDPAVIVYTSGSTGRPKGVVKSHRAILHRAWLSARYDHLRPGDRQSLLTYCSFASAEADVFGALLNGATIELFDAANAGLDEFASWIARRQITVLHPPVVLFRRFLSTLESSGQFPSVRLIAMAGEAVTTNDLQLWRRYFGGRCVLRNRFSSTEAGHIAVACIGSADAIDSLPPVVAVPDKHVTVVDDAGNLCPDGETGELVVRSRFVAEGYWRNGGIDRSHFTEGPAHPGERVFHTGDLGRRLADGRFEFAGRRDGQVKVRGYRVELREIERVIQEQTGVNEAAVVAVNVNDENRLIAFVVAGAGATVLPETLRRNMTALLPPWKVPADFRLIDVLPLTLTGKIDRPALIALSAFTAPLTVAPVVMESDPILAGLLSLWRELLGRPALGPDDDFFDHGGHSLMAAQLVHRIKQQFGQTIPLATIIASPTARKMSDSLKSTVDKGAPDARDGSIVTLKAGIGSPFFCLPVAHATALTYLPLGRLLNTDGPVYALLFPTEALPTTLEQVAAGFVRLIQASSPVGPYHLCGHSFGGLLAYEVARQLAAEKAPVGLLALLDSEVLSSRVPLPIRRRLMRHGMDLICGGPPSLTRGARRLLNRPADAPPASAGEGETVLPDSLDDRVGARTRLFRTYRPGRYGGTIDLFQAEIQPRWKRFNRPQPSNGWDSVCDHVRVHPVSGDHLSMMQGPPL